METPAPAAEPRPPQPTGSGPSADPADRAGPLAVEAVDAVEASDDFRELRRSYRSFAFPVTVAFLGWYLLYVLLSSFADGMMSTTVAGHLNVAFVLGVAQFATTFLIAWLYARYAGTRLDPRAARLKDRLEAGSDDAGRPAVPAPGEVV